MVFTRKMKRTLEEQNDTPAPETPAFKALRTGYENRQQVLQLTYDVFCNNTPVTYCADENKYEQMFEQLLEKICPTGEIESEAYYNGIEKYLYEFVAGVFLRVTDGGKTKLTVSEKLLAFCLSKETTADPKAMISYVKAHRIKDDSLFYNYDNETADSIHTLMNWFDTVLEMYCENCLEPEDKKTGVFKAEKLAGDGEWLLSLNEEYNKEKN